MVAATAALTDGRRSIRSSVTASADAPASTTATAAAAAASLLLQFGTDTIVDECSYIALYPWRPSGVVRRAVMMGSVNMIVMVLLE